MAEVVGSSPTSSIAERLQSAGFWCRGKLYGTSSGGFLGPAGPISGPKPVAIDTNQFLGMLVGLLPRTANTPGCLVQLTSRRATSDRPIAASTTTHATSTRPPAAGESRCSVFSPISASCARVGVKRPTDG